MPAGQKLALEIGPDGETVTLGVGMSTKSRRSATHRGTSERGIGAVRD